jgi:NAD(P)-dependent dehydrogenase (short-subunit alcohol dehydrogenase family)
MSSPKSVNQAIAAVQQDIAGITILVNGAGISGKRIHLGS